MGTGGTIEPIHNAVTLAELAVGKGAKSLLLPVSSRRLFDLSDEMATKLDIEFYQDGRDALLNLDSTIIGNAAGAQRKRRPNDSSCTDFRHGPLQKNRDQEIAPTDIGYRDFVVSCVRSPDRDCWDHRRSRSGDRSHRTFFTRRLITETANFIGCDLTV